MLVTVMVVEIHMMLILLNMSMLWLILLLIHAFKRLEKYAGWYRHRRIRIGRNRLKIREKIKAAGSTRLEVPGSTRARIDIGEGAVERFIYCAGVYRIRRVSVKLKNIIWCSISVEGEKRVKPTFW